jgi:hypothetical protein
MYSRARRRCAAAFVFAPLLVLVRVNWVPLLLRRTTTERGRQTTPATA